MKYTIYSLLVFMIFIFFNPEDVVRAKENKFTLSLGGGINQSKPIALPKTLGNEYVTTHKITELRGLNIVGLVKRKYEHYVFATGLGYKTINFNFDQNFNPPNDWAITQSIAEPRLKYLYIPIKVYYPTLYGKLYLSASAELCKLFDTINYEQIKSPIINQISDNNSLFWFDEYELFLFLGIGGVVFNKINIEFEIGMTPTYVNYDYTIKEDSTLSLFHFAKKLYEIRFNVYFDFPDFKIN